MNTTTTNLPKTKTLTITLELELDEDGNVFDRGKGMYCVTPESMADLQKALLDANVSPLLSHTCSFDRLEFTLEHGWKRIEHTCGGLKGINEKRERYIEQSTNKDGTQNVYSRFNLRWLQHLEDHLYGGGSLEELFRRVMSTDEMKRLLRTAAKQSGKDLDESQLNLLASNQDLAKAYVKPILDAIQTQQTQAQTQQQDQTQPSQQQSSLEQLAEQMLNVDVIQQRIRQSLSVAISDKEFAAMLQNQQFRKTCIEDIIQGILKGDTSQATSNSNGSKLNDLINSAPESQSEPDAESQQQETQTQTQPEQEQDQDQTQA